MLIGRMRSIGAQLAPSAGLRRGANSAVLSLAVITILVLTNVIAARHHWRFDTTKNREHSLAPATVDLLKNLKQDVKFIAFPDPNASFQGAMTDLFKEYRYHAGNHLRYEFVDAEAQPGLAEQYKVNAFDTVVVVAGKKTERVDSYDMTSPPGPDGQPQFNGEAALTGALARVTQSRQYKVYFLEGHAERTSASNPSRVHKALTDEGYAVDNLNLLLQPQVPADADVLVVAGPQRDISAQEQATLQDWAKKGGRLLLLLDPAKEAMPHLTALAGSYGVKLDNDLVVDPGRHLRSDNLSLVPQYQDHTITGKTAATNQYMLVPFARSLELPKDSKDWDVTSLLETSQNAWGQLALDSAKLGYDAARGDRKGPFSLAAAVEQKGDAARKQRAVVVGTSAFATDERVQMAPANLDFVLNSVAWLTDRGSAINIRARPASEARLFLTGGQVNSLFYGVVVAVPLSALLVGGAVWLRRRHL